MVHWIAIHFLIHYLPFKNFAVCCSFSITHARIQLKLLEWSLFAVVCLRLYILTEKAYLKYERVLPYSNDRLVGFSTASLPVETALWLLVVKKVIVCFPMSLLKENIHLTVQLSIRYWGYINVKATHSCSSRRDKKKNRKRKENIMGLQEHKSP